MKGRIALARVLLLGAASLMVALAVAAFSSRYSRYLALEAKVATLEREMDRLREENIRLKSQVAVLHRPDHIEGLARERLGLAKPGELAVRVTEPPDPSGVRPAGRSPDTLRVPRVHHKEGSSPERKEEMGLSWWDAFWRRIRDRLREVF